MDLSLTRVGASCAIATVIAFVAGLALMAASGVQVLIPETGADGVAWVRDVDEAGGTFFLGAWLAILGGLLGIPALIGFYNALRQVGAWLILAPILSSVSLSFAAGRKRPPVSLLRH